MGCGSRPETGSCRFHGARAVGEKKSKAPSFSCMIRCPSASDHGLRQTPSCICDPSIPHRKLTFRKPVLVQLHHDATKDPPERDRPTLYSCLRARPPDMNALSVAHSELVFRHCLPLGGHGDEVDSLLFPDMGGQQVLLVSPTSVAVKKKSFWRRSRPTFSSREPFCPMWWDTPEPTFL